jgi:hypothetical protein
MAMQMALKAIYRHGPQITVSRQEACDLRFNIVVFMVNIYRFKYYLPIFAIHPLFYIVSQNSHMPVIF